MTDLKTLLRVAAMLAIAGIAPRLDASDLFVSGIIGTCQPVDMGGYCGVSFQLYPNAPQSIPSDWAIDSITLSYEVVNDSSTSPAEYALGLNQNPLQALYFPILATLTPSQDLSTSVGPLTQGDAGNSPAGFGTPSSLDFSQTNWNDPTNNGVLPAVFYNVSTTGATVTLESITLDLDYTLISEPGSLGLMALGLLLALFKYAGGALNHQVSRALKGNR